MDGSPAITHLSVTKKAWKKVTKIVYWRLTHLICSDNRSKHNLHIILKLGGLLATYSLSVRYLFSKHDSR